MFLKTAKFFFILILFPLIARGSQALLDPDFYQSEIDEVVSRLHDQTSYSSLQAMTQNEFKKLIESSELSPEDASFLSSSIKNTFETSHFILDARWKNFFTYSNSQPTHLLELDAQTNPFLSQNQGLYTLDGSFGGTALDFYAEAYGLVSATVRPYLIFQDQNGLRHFDLQEAYGSLHIRQLSVDVGKASVRWGYGAYQPMIFSDNFEPFFMVRIRNNEEIHFDNFLSFLGEIKFDMFHGWLDEFRTYPHGKIIGVNFSFQPTPRFNFHLSQTVLYGGDGSPTNNPLVFFTETFVDKTNPANRNNTFGFRYRIPKIEIEPYLDVYVEDCCGSPPINPRDMLQLFGVYIPRYGQNKWDVAIEWVRTNYITYRHEAFDYTQSQKVLGHPIGPDATGLYAVGRYFHSKAIQLDQMLAYEIRGQEGRALSNSGFIDIRTVEPTYQNPEKRYRFEEFIQYFANPNWKWTLHTGIEKINDYNYQIGINRWQAIIGIDSTYHF